jgi:hypothetical protein
MPEPMVYSCDYCGRPLRANRHVCGSCYKQGRYVNSTACKDCGAPTSNRQRTLCEACRQQRRCNGEERYVGRQAVIGSGREQIMLEAEIPLRDDDYARTAHVLTDEEIAAKREKFLALLAADVHVGSCGRPSYHNYAAQRDGDAVGGFGTLAHQHMRGGEAGHGTDREHTVRAQQNRESRARRDA